MRGKPQPVYRLPPLRRTLYGRAPRPLNGRVRGPAAQLQLLIPTHQQQLQPSGQGHQYALLIGSHTASDRCAGATDGRTENRERGDSDLTKRLAEHW